MTTKETIKLRLESVWIRIRAWLHLINQLGAIGLFLVGVVAVYRARTAEGRLDPSLFGYDVTPMFGFTSHETLMYGGIIVMMVGLGLAYRWTISDRHGHATY